VDPLVVDIAIAVVSLGLFATAYGGALLATRPARPPAGPATPDLGDEPPAVVNLLANRWRLNEDAAEATLLDLAARRIIEIRQPANDPLQSTIHLREGTGEGAELPPYERRVRDRIRGLAVNGVIPVTALTFRNEHRAKQWNRRLHREVVADARARGLSRRRFGPELVSALVAVAAVSAGGLFLATARNVLRDDDPDSDLGAALWVGVLAFGVLSAIAGSQRGERDTPAGRAVAARWLGVRAWLRGHEEFADLPPAAVTVWDRYLPYGAALGVTHTASAVLDLGMGNRRLVWSSYGDRWRRVRVRYPRFWGRYGRTVPSLLFPALLSLLVGGLLVRYHELPAEFGTGAGGVAGPELERASQLALLLGVLVLIRGGYRVVRTLVDLATTRTITGEVLWLEVWRSKSQGKNRPSVPWLHYLAIDDGHAERTTAWGLPAGTGGPRCHDGDTVRIRVRPWSRRVVELALVERGRAYRLADPPVAGEAGGFGQAVAAALGQPGSAPDVLLTAEEVGQALGLPVRPPERLPTPGFVATVVFATADRNRQVLMVQACDGTVGRWAWRSNSRGTALPGIGDGAYLAGDRAALRVGETTLVLTLLRDAKGRHSQLPWLLQRAAARLTGPATPGGEAPAGSAHATDLR
jgi:hypothetical protein